MYDALVVEMNEPFVEQGLTKHRKIMTSFRETALFKIFNVSARVCVCVCVCVCVVMVVVGRVRIWTRRMRGVTCVGLHCVVIQSTSCVGVPMVTWE